MRNVYVPSCSSVALSLQIHVQVPPDKATIGTNLTFLKPLLNSPMKKILRQYWYLQLHAIILHLGTLYSSTNRQCAVLCKKNANKFRRNSPFVYTNSHGYFRRSYEILRHHLSKKYRFAAWKFAYNRENSLIYKRYFKVISLMAERKFE